MSEKKRLEVAFGTIVIHSTPSHPTPPKSQEVEEKEKKKYDKNKDDISLSADQGHKKLFSNAHKEKLRCGSEQKQWIGQFILELVLRVLMGFVTVHNSQKRFADSLGFATVDNNCKLVTMEGRFWPD